MTLLRRLTTFYRLLTEGRAAVEAQHMAESLLDTKLPHDVRADCHEIITRIASFSSVEELAMIYVIKYAERMALYLDAVDATQEYRTHIARGVERACVSFAGRKRAGIQFEGYWLDRLAITAKTHGIQAKPARDAAPKFYNC